MMQSTLNLSAVMPELLLLLAACVVLIVEALADPDKPGNIDRYALAAMAVPGLALLAQAGRDPVEAFGGMYRLDAFALTMKAVALLAMVATVVYARRYAEDRGIGRGELYSLGLMSLLGQFVIMSGSNLLVLYLGLELMSLPLYALVAIRRTSSRSTEAGLKYFVLGALASGFMLYGMSMIYGATGTLDIDAISRALSLNPGGRTVLIFATVFVVAGLAFKFGAVPFHMWVPDIYQGAPTTVTLMIAGGSKLAAFALAFRLLGDALGVVAADWQKMLFVLALLSLVVGNVVAVAQTNFKRMIAYSAISQVGFVLLGMAGVVRSARAGAIVTDPASQFIDAFGGAMFYTITYVLTTLATLGIIQLLSRDDHEFEEIADFKGLARRSPWIAGVMLVMMFSLAGIPPLVGFYAKLSVLESVVASGQVWIAVVAVLLSLIGAFYYLRIVKVMYFDEPVAGRAGQGHSVASAAGHDAEVVLGGDGSASLRHAPAISLGLDSHTVLALNAVLVIALGILPGPLMNLCTTVVRQALRIG